MDTPSLHTKLQTALITTCRTMALGSGNKIANYENTHGWSAVVHDQLRKNNDRLYQCYPLSQEENPLKDLSEIPYFIRNLVKEYIVVLNKERVGNCGEMARFIALYLWKNPGKDIHSIEIVSANKFDHTWVIVNRKKDSDLLKPEEWGDAWCVDAWWGDEGAFYHASEYHQKIMQLLYYIKEQNEGLYKKGRIKSNELENFNSTYDQYLKDFQKNSLKIPLTVKHFAIYPEEVPYPVDIDNQKMRSLEDYYDYCPYKYGNYNCRTRMMDEKIVHQQCFLPCLEEIKSRGFVSSIAAVEEKFLKPKFEM